MRPSTWMCRPGSMPAIRRRPSQIDGDQAAAVVQLGLERRDAAAGPEGDRPQRALERDALRGRRASAIGQQPGLDRVVAELAGLLAGVARPAVEARRGAGQACDSCPQLYLRSPDITHRSDGRPDRRPDPAGPSALLGTCRKRSAAAPRPGGIGWLPAVDDDVAQRLLQEAVGLELAWPGGRTSSPGAATAARRCPRTVDCCVPCCAVRTPTAGTTICRAVP